MLLISTDLYQSHGVPSLLKLAFLSGVVVVVKFIYSEKVTEFCEISTNYLYFALPVK